MPYGAWPKPQLLTSLESLENQFETLGHAVVEVAYLKHSLDTRINETNLNPENEGVERTVEDGHGVQGGRRFLFRLADDNVDATPVIQEIVNLVRQCILKLSPPNTQQQTQCHDINSIFRISGLTYSLNYFSTDRPKDAQQIGDGPEFLRFNQHFDVGWFNIVYFYGNEPKGFELRNNDGYYTRLELNEPHDWHVAQLLVLPGMQTQELTDARIQAPWHRVTTVNGEFMERKSIVWKFESVDNNSREHYESFEALGRTPPQH